MICGCASVHAKSINFHHLIWVIATSHYAADVTSESLSFINLDPCQVQELMVASQWELKQFDPLTMHTR